MTEQTPLQRLDDAVHEWYAATRSDGEDRANIAGWVISYQTQELILDPPEDVEPVEWGADFSISPNFSPFAAAGILDYSRTFITDLYTTLTRDDLTGEDG